MRYAHTMPFGAEVVDGATRFRLWAPGASRVDVELIGGATPVRHRLAARERGWFEATLDGARAGARYLYRIDDRISVPDPASRSNPDGVHAASVVIDPRAYRWRTEQWRGRRWEEAVIYELHVGTFTPGGTFASAIDKLDYLVDLGVTAIELMPVASFAGRRNWGYDGVLLFAPAACYGTPDDLKRLVDASHARGLMVLIDVVYNHFGPEGNYLYEYAPRFFNAQHRTPWGPAINFDGDGNRDVRDFFVHNALYWIDEFRADGLRIDAVHAIADSSQPDAVCEIATALHRAADAERHVHVVLENDRNEFRYLERDAAGEPRCASAQWNDDVHHALHVIATGERDGYYGEFADRPVELLGRALAEGFAWQGERSPWRSDQPRGDPSAALPPSAFVDFIQTHDQAGNRAFGERISAIADPRALRAAVACVLLAPAVPLLFMGEEFAASTPFLFFCDFGPDLAVAVTRGRREEFGRFERFRDARAQESIPDPGAQATFDASKLDWRDVDAERGRELRALYRRLLAIRREHIVPRLRSTSRGGTYSVHAGRTMHVRWMLGDDSQLHLVANLGDAPAPAVAPPGDRLYVADGMSADAGEWPPFGVVCTLERRS